MSRPANRQTCTALSGFLALILWVCGSLFICAVPVSAQRVRAVVLEDVTGQPLSGAIASLLDANGATTQEGLTDASGSRSFAIERSGIYRFRVRRIGYAPFMSDTIALSTETMRDVTIKVPAQRAVLSTVRVVESGKTCRPSEQNSLGSAGVLWEVVRNNLLANEMTIRDSLVQTRVETFERILDARQQVLENRASPARLTSGRAFVPADTVALAEHGYIVESGGDLTYFGPDARVLLSREFETDHCFDMHLGTGPQSGLVGLSFDPVVRRKLPDIAGVLWVDTTSGQLRRVDFHYTNSPAKLSSSEVGGTIEFRRMASGALIVTGWIIRMPRINVSITNAGPVYSLSGFVERGGLADVASVESGAGATQAGVRKLLSEPTVRGRVVGTVFDSLLSRGLRGARVQIDGVDAVAVTDSGGRFALDGVPAGQRNVRVTSDLLDSLGVSRIVAEIDVFPGADAGLRLATPSLHSFKAGVCGDSADLVTGVVRDAGTGKSVPGAHVQISWLAVSRLANGAVHGSVEERIAPADSGGRYTSCIEPRSEAMAKAVAGAKASGRVPINPGARRIAVLDLYVASALAAGSAPRVEGFAEPQPLRGRAALMGFVRDPSGRPIEGATVVVNDAGLSEKTDSSGRFDLRLLPEGSHTFDVVRVGFSPARSTGVFRSDHATELDVVMQPIASLEAVRVTDHVPAVGSVRNDVMTRKKLGFGVVMSAEDIARLPVDRIESLLENVPSLVVAFESMDAKIDAAGRHGPGHLVLKFPTMRAVGEGYCDANVYIDGRYTDNIDDVRSLAASQIAAIEVYKRPTEAPAKYALLRNGCGVIMIWTKAAWR